MTIQRCALVICCHPPHEDPRVIWHISSLKDRYRVSVLCVEKEASDDAAEEYMTNLVEHRSARHLLRPLPLGPFCKAYTYFKRQIMAYSYCWPRNIVFLVLLAVEFRNVRAYSCALMEEADKLKEHFDLILAIDLHALKAGEYVKKTRGGILVYDSHENWACVRPGTTWMYEHVVNAYQRRYVQTVDLITTVSPLLVEYLGRKLHYSKVTLLPNATPIKCMRCKGMFEKGEEREAEYDQQIRALAHGRLVVVFQGNVAAERGLREIVAAWKHVPKDEAILIMRAPDHPSIELKAVIEIARKDGTLEESVFLLPSVSEDDLIVAASAADVGIIPYRPTFPNHVMACPNKLSQYMQAGLAIFSNDIPYVREIVEAAEMWGDIWGRGKSARSSRKNSVAAKRQDEAG